MTFGLIVIIIAIIVHISARDSGFAASQSAVAASQYTYVTTAAMNINETHFEDLAPPLPVYAVPPLIALYPKVGWMGSRTIAYYDNVVPFAASDGHGGINWYYRSIDAFPGTVAVLWGENGSLRTPKRILSIDNAMYDLPLTLATYRDLSAGSADQYDLNTSINIYSMDNLPSVISSTQPDGIVLSNGSYTPYGPPSAPGWVWYIVPVRWDDVPAIQSKRMNACKKSVLTYAKDTAFQNLIIDGHIHPEDLCVFIDPVADQTTD